MISVQQTNERLFDLVNNQIVENDLLLSSKSLLNSISFINIIKILNVEFDLESAYDIRTQLYYKGYAIMDNKKLILRKEHESADE